MRTVGIIAEYNPLHTGHAYHLQEARRHAQADLVAVVMSTSFVQRGEPAFFDTDRRVQMALAAGADAVFALPAVWAVRDAEHFALGGVEILRKIGCDAICFGAETENPALMRDAADLIEENGEPLRQALQPLLKQGIPYPQALSAAAEQLLPGSGALLSSPNNTLGVCYLRAMRRLHTDMTPVIIPRQSDYHAEALEPDRFPSATAIRAAWRAQGPDAVLPYLPENCHRLIANAPAASMDTLAQALFYRLRTMSPEDYRALPDVSEGLENRLYDAAQAASTLPELLEKAGTKRYPRARLQRLCTHALLQLTHEMLQTLPLPEPWLLGMRESARPLLRQARENGVHILSRSAELLQDALWVQKEKLAHDLWRMAAHCPPDSLMSRKLIRTEGKEITT